MKMKIPFKIRFTAEWNYSLMSQSTGGTPQTLFYVGALLTEHHFQNVNKMPDFLQWFYGLLVAFLCETQ